MQLVRETAVVQVGATTGANHTHFDLSGVTDLRGKTSGRELIQLIHHWEGVLSPVTFVMHLAAAVPMRSNAPISGEDPRRKFLMMFISGISMRFL